MKVVAVTGANGMIGQRIIQRLLRQGVRIRALVRNDRPSENCIEYITGDITTKHIIENLLDGVDTVFHCAAELNDDKNMHEINVIATKNLVNVAVDLGVSCFIHLSSAGVVGPSTEDWIDETTSCFPNNPYEISKYQAEQALSKIVLNGLRLCILRPTNVIDTNRPGVLAWRNNWLDKFFILIKGAEGAHLVHAEDVAAATIHLANPETALNGIFFVGCDEDKRNTLLGVSNMRRTLMGRKIATRDYCMPVIVPYFIRLFTRGKSLHGHSRFSSAKLIATGFKFPLGLDGTISSICFELEDCD